MTSITLLLCRVRLHRVEFTAHVNGPNFSLRRIADMISAGARGFRGLSMHLIQSP